MLDTRGLRDAQVAGNDFKALADPKRSLLGAAQEAWLFDELRASQRAGSRWRMLGQQVLFTPLSIPGLPVANTDLWDGYAPARNRVFDLLASDTITDVAILTGDIHSSWALDVPRNPFTGYDPDDGRRLGRDRTRDAGDQLAAVLCLSRAARTRGQASAARAPLEVPRRREETVTRCWT